MIENLILRTENIFISDINTVHVDFYPANIGIENAVMLGAELNYTNSTIADAIENYRETARQELLRYLNEKFTGQYE